MAKAVEISTKRLAITKANAQMVAVVAVAAFISVFCLVASKALFSQVRYQSRVTSAKEKAHDQLLTNIQNYSHLATSYKNFDSQNTNVIGGLKNGNSDNDGTNSKIILDALPSTYDFPALTASLEKILTDRSLSVNGINGTDDQLNQQSNVSSPEPTPSTIPFSFIISNANYNSIQQLVDALQHSVRPMSVDTLVLSGGQNDMTATVTAHTYYQPAKSLNIKSKVVK